MHKMTGTDRAFIEIDLSHLEHNARVLQAAMPPGCKLMAVLKANAYGHGAFFVAAHLNKIGVDAFAVATVDEGIRLREYGINGEILILGYTDVHRARELRKYDLTQTLTDLDYARALSAQNIRLKTHLKIDTGMHRLGIDSRDVPHIKEVFSLKNLEIRGIYTHLCCADSLLPEDVAFTKEQIDRFYNLTAALKTQGIPVPKTHIQSSYGLINYPHLNCDYARIGIALYGVPSVPPDCADTDRFVPGTDCGAHPGRSLWSDLRPVLSLKSRVVLIRFVPKGDPIGYGRSFTASRDSRIAVLSVGYADGLPRTLSKAGARVMIRGQYAPVIGRVCMDQLTVDVTDLANIQAGDTAVLIDTDRYGSLTAPVVAAAADSISNELLSRLGPRLPVRAVP